MQHFLISAGLFWLCELAAIAVIALISRKTERITRAPGVDVAMAFLTWIPWVAAACLFGWPGLLGCVIGQFAGMQTFCFWDWWRRGRKGPSICGALNRLVGPANNNIALIATLPALPAFLLIRFSQLTTYPILVRLIRLPPYNHADWVSVSRQKFGGLIGHDLVWCLYCDWMTGIYALGGEMLRNLESFWCPIRFYPGKKCENCKLDFPDVEKWVPPDGSMADVEKKLLEKYEGRRWNSWWSHPDRKSDG